MSLILRVPRVARGARSVEHERGLISPADRARPGLRTVIRVAQTVVVAGLLVGGLGPLVFLLKAALSPTQDTLRDPFALFPSGEVLWRNLEVAWSDLHVGRLLWNTAVMAGGSALASVVVATLGAYALSVLRPRWAPILTGAVLATLLVPTIVSVVPLYLVIVDVPLAHVSLLDSYWAVWLPAAANAFNVLLLKRFFDGIPREVLEAAQIDGAGPLRMLWSVVLPLSRPIMGVVALLTVVTSWKDYLWPLLVLQDPNKQPISVAIPLIAERNELSVVMAALFIAVIVPIVLFLVFQRQILSGVSASSGTKG